MKDIVVVNQFYSDNIGDKLLNKSLVDSLLELGYSVHNLGFAQTIEQDIVYGCDNAKNILMKLKHYVPAIIKYIIRYHWNLLNESQQINWETISAVIIGGGQLLKHLTVFKYCLLFWYCISKKHHIPFILYGIGIDNDVDFIEKQIYKIVLQGADYINCRDNTSAIIAKQILGKDVEVTPDIAFTYLVEDIENTEESVIIIPYSYVVYQSSFGYSKTRDEYYKQIMDLIRNNIQLDQYRIILSATTSSDAFECYSFQEYLKREGFDSVLIESHDVRDIIKLLKSSKYLVSGRMHALILSLLCRVTPIAIPVSEKISTFQENYIKKKINLEDIRIESYKGIKLLNDVLENKT